MATTVKRVTISLPNDLVLLTNKIAREKRISRSMVVSACLQEMADKRFQKEMEDGYRAMAEDQKQLAKMSFDAQRNIIPVWD